MVSFESICGGLLICVAEVSRLEPQKFVPDPLPTEALCALWGSDHNPQNDAKSKSPKVQMIANAVDVTSCNRCNLYR